MCLKFPVRRSPATTRQGTPAARIRREAVTYQGVGWGDAEEGREPSVSLPLTYCDQDAGRAGTP